MFTDIGKQNGGKALSAKDITLGDPFVYKHLGSMATVGRYKALVDLRQAKVHYIHHHLYYSSTKTFSQSGLLDSVTLHLGFVSSCNINQERACPVYMYLSILCFDLYFVCQGEKGVSLAGFTSWLIWRSAYLTRVISWRNRFYVAMNWGTTLIFGRDNTKIG